MALLAPLAFACFFNLIWIALLEPGMRIRAPPSFELDGLSKWPVPRNHTSVDKFNLKDGNSVVIDSYHVGDDLWIQLYTNPEETEYDSYPAMIVAIHRSNNDLGPISLVISYYYWRLENRKGLSVLARTLYLHIFPPVYVMATAQKFLKEGADVDAKDTPIDRTTPLCWAARNGHEAVIKLLLDTGNVNANSKGKDGLTPLLWVAQNGHEAVVKLLLDTCKVDADSKDRYGRTPLLWATRNGHDEAVVQLLLDTGKVDADSKGEDGRTPLSWAAENGNDVVMKLLLDTDKVDADSKGKDGRTPLLWAAANGHDAVVKLLE
ncbi:hypothetical protein VE03_10475 [Pseudogymnoascus sp. 23342-1-I1]|nr:hypothetical protein VE03_10475 [Pseudogymnoascus sp. 23342-1-I1]